MPVHVSIHDVSPAWEREVDVALEMAWEAGCRPALLVVPDYHGRSALVDHPKFIDRLRTLEKDGHEIYLHGYYHRAGIDHDHTAAPEQPARSLTDRLRHAFAQKVVSASEAEFSDVSIVARLCCGRPV